MTTPLEIIVLAAGQGTRMRSDLPKVLHPIGGRPLLECVCNTAAALAPERIHVVYGHGGAEVRERLGHLEVHWVEQAEQLGTGHAVAQAIDAVDPGSRVLVLYGDVPLITAGTLRRLAAAADGERLALLTVRLSDPTGYGRVVRGADGAVCRIVEQKDATTDEAAIDEINTGFLAVGAARLAGWLARLGNDNAQGEYYLTDIFAMAAADSVPIATEGTGDAEEVMGINDRVQLATLERALQRRQAEALMRDGVTLTDPARFDLRGELTVGRDVVIEPNVIIEGQVSLGDRVRIGANTVLTNVQIGTGTEVLPMSVLEDAIVGTGCHIGPFARIRPGTRLADGARIGNFVEVKKSDIGAGSKVNHLSYIGDTRMGAGVNIGAGTITCNYDGANKHRTLIGDGAFIGSDTQLVAPVEIGEGATIGAGSTITREAPPGELTLSRSRQQTVKGWKPPKKSREE